RHDRRFEMKCGLVVHKRTLISMNWLVYHDVTVLRSFHRIIVGTGVWWVYFGNEMRFSISIPTIIRKTVMPSCHNTVKSFLGSRSRLYPAFDNATMHPVVYFSCGSDIG